MLLFQGLKNRNKNKIINNQITKLNTELIDKKLFISFIGKEFEGNPKYLWNIKIGSKEVNITSKKSIIALSKSNTKKNIQIMVELLFLYKQKHIKVLLFRYEIIKKYS